MSYIYETHLHTDESSNCGRSPAREYIPYYQDLGYQGIIVTDHFTGNPRSYVPDRNAPWRAQIDRYCLGYEEALDEGIKRGFDVFFGIEQGFADDECLVYGIDKQWLYDNPEIVRWNRRELFDAVNAVGGCIVHAHPFRERGYIKNISINNCVHAVEAFNAGNTLNADIYGKAFAEYYNLPMTAGSDIHWTAQRTGDDVFGVVFDKPWTSIHDYVDAIRNHKPFSVRHSEGRGEGAHEPLATPLDYRDANDCRADWDPEILFR